MVFTSSTCGGRQDAMLESAFDVKSLSRAFAQPPGDFLLRVELAPPPRQLVGAYKRDIVVVAFPGGVSAPAQRRLHGGLRSRCGFQHAQCKLQREGLGVWIVRSAGRIAERKIAEQESCHRSDFPLG